MNHQYDPNTDIDSIRDDSLVDTYKKHVNDVNDMLKYVHFQKESDKRLKRFEYYRTTPWYKQLLVPVPPELKACDFPDIISPTVVGFEDWKARRAHNE